MSSRLRKPSDNIRISAFARSISDASTCSGSDSGAIPDAVPSTNPKHFGHCA